MQVSTGLPRQIGTSGIAQVIAARESPVEIERVSESVGSLDETTTTTATHIEDIWLFQPRESVAEELVGERINGGLGGLVVASRGVDLQHDDRVTYGGVEYELDTIVGHPTDSDPDGGRAEDTDFWILSFTRRQ